MLQMIFAEAVPKPVAVVLWGSFIIMATIWLGGCASALPASELLDRDQIKRHSDKSMQEMQKEEDRRRPGGY